MNRIKSLKVKELENGSMTMELSLNDENQNDVNNKVFDIISDHSTGEASYSGSNLKWLNVHQNFDVALAQKDIILIEKNNNEGPYGKGIALQVVPEVFFQWGLISQEEKIQFSSVFSQFEPVIRRQEALDNIKVPNEDEFKQILARYGIN